MLRCTLIAAAAFAAMPIAGMAQSPAPMMSPMAAPAPPMAPRMRPTMSPEMMMRLEHARTDARVAAYAALSPSHRAQVAAIVAQVNSGKLDTKTAAAKIDAVLTYNEGKAILAAGMKGMMAMHGPHMRRPLGAPGMPGAPGGPPPGGMRGHCDMTMGGPPGSAPMAMTSPAPGMMSPAPPMAPGMSPPPMRPGWRNHGMMHHGDRWMHGPPDAGTVMLLVAVSQDKAMKMMHDMHPMPPMNGMHAMRRTPPMPGQAPMPGQPPMMQSPPPAMPMATPTP